MNLVTSLLRELENPGLSRSQRAGMRCEVAREYEDRGEYEEARQVMGELWQRIGEPPRTEGLDAATAAEVFLRAGVLAGWIGSKNQVTDAQETAKGLLCHSLSAFESLKLMKRAAEAQIELALCYWRAEEHSEARDLLRETLSRLCEEDELRAKALLRLSIVEWSARDCAESLRILLDNAPLFQKIENHAIRGGYHNALAGVLEDMGTAEQREDYVDRALIEYTAASYHFEQAKHRNYRGHVENNLGFLHFKFGAYREAHEHLDRARRLFITLKNKSAVAEVDETRARVFLAEGRNTEAEKTARSSVITLEQGGPQALLTEALITHGTALARLRYYSQAYATLQHAIEEAQAAGSLQRAGEAALILVQELGEHLAPRGERSNFTGCGIEDIRRYEHDLIKDALLKAEGSITHAACLLGTSYQRITYLIETRHKDLLKTRTPKRSRPRRI